MCRKISTILVLGLTLIGTVSVAAQMISRELGDAVNAAVNFADWNPADDLYPKENAKLAFENGKSCIEEIDKAMSRGLSASAAIETDKGRMTVAEARSMCVSVRDKGQKFFGELTEKEEALYRPFKSILTGDKLRLYNDRLKSYKLYGLGGKVLKTPEDYRDSTLWCTTGVDRDGIVPVWSVDCWHFKGMAMVGTVTSRTGTGDEAPSSAFR